MPSLKQEAEHDVLGNPLTDLSCAGNILFSFVFKSPVPEGFFFLSPSAARGYGHSALLLRGYKLFARGSLLTDTKRFLARGGEEAELPEVHLLGGLFSQGRS